MRYPLAHIGITQGHHYGKCLDFGWNSNYGGPNAPIFAVDDGVVVDVCYTKKGGNNVCIEHPNNTVSNYCHLSKTIVKKGDKVVLGQQIGNMGMTGTDANAPHLHFGLVSKGKNPLDKSDLDPFDYLELYEDQHLSDKTKTTYGNKIKVHKEESTPVTNSTQKIYLPVDAKSWKVYPLNKKPVVGNECGKLLPSKFGGLEYDVLDWNSKDVAIIETRDFGKVQIYVAESTGAIIK